MERTSSLVYQWDHNCQRIHDKIQSQVWHIQRELFEMECDHPPDLKHLLFFYKKWHYNNELHTRTKEEISTRKRVLESLLKKGYGVSTALADDMAAIQRHDLSICFKRLQEVFARELPGVKNHIYLPRDQEANHNSGYIIRELCKKLNEDYDSNLPQVEAPLPRIPIDLFLSIERETPPYAHMAIMDRMFLELTEESATIMEGTIGEVNTDSPEHLKYIASRNLRELFIYLYDSIGRDIVIDIDSIRTIHHSLTRDLDLSHTWNAGEFRTEDFEDKSGLTFEFGNFGRGIEELAHFLAQADWQADNLQKFTSALARLYYMLLSIHPFLDSNGRTSKCLINHLIMRRGLPPLLFDVHEEILCLPRYGGTVMMMQQYFMRRIAASIERYLFEREKIVHHNNLEKYFFRVDFDAGFYFRHLNGLFPLIEVDFKIYVLDEGHERYQSYLNQCKIVVPEEKLIHEIDIYYGFTRKHSRQWEGEGTLQIASLWKRGTDSHGVLYYHANAFISLGPHLAPYFNLELSLACPSRSLIFNNKSLNYVFAMDRPHLIRIIGDWLVKKIVDDPFFCAPSLETLRRLRERLEHSSSRLARLHECPESGEVEYHAAMQGMHPQPAAEFREVFVPLVLHFLETHNFLEREDLQDPDNGQLLLYCVHHLVPYTVKIFGYP